jgi:hypothetical protein
MNFIKKDIDAFIERNFPYVIFSSYAIGLVFLGFFLNALDQEHSRNIGILKTKGENMYIILCDTQGRGLEQFDCCGLDLIEEKDLKSYILSAFCEMTGEFDEINDELIKQFCGESIVILSLVENYKKQPLEKFIEKTIKDEIKNINNKEHKEYLRLKEKFEKK